MKESLIQSAIEHYLIILENQNKIIYQKNNSGAYKTERGGFVRFGKAGSPDFYIFGKGGKCIHLEIKNETGKLNDNQKNYKDNIENLDHVYFVARSLDEVENYLKLSKIV